MYKSLCKGGEDNIMAVSISEYMRRKTTASWVRVKEVTL
jgi:hypothetical protein